MACSVSEELTAYADGELAAADRARVESHLAGCAECTADLALLQALAPKLSAAVPAIEPSQQLRRNVLNALPEKKAGWSFWRFAIPAGGLAAAAAVAVMVLGPKPPAPSADVGELALVENLEVVENLDALQTADLSDEDLEVIANLDQLEKKE